jgi:hypothetical protein
MRGIEPGALGDDWPTGISSHRRTLNRLGVAEFELENNSPRSQASGRRLDHLPQQREHGVDCAEVLFSLVFAAVQNFERAGMRLQNRSYLRGS